MKSIPRPGWLILAAISIAAVALVSFAPAEQTLGDGIRSVYVHVALTWTGMAAWVAAGLLRIAALFPRFRALESWAQTTAGVGLAFFVAGFAMSMVAANVNWGAVTWLEPRARTALNVIALALIVQILNSWLSLPGVRALLSAGLVAFVVWSTLVAPLVLHPRDPIRTSSSTAIQMTFLGLFVICCLGAGWIVWVWRLQRRPKSADV